MLLNNIIKIKYSLAISRQIATNSLGNDLSCLGTFHEVPLDSNPIRYNPFLALEVLLSDQQYLVGILSPNYLIAPFIFLCWVYIYIYILRDFSSSRFHMTPQCSLVLVVPPHTPPFLPLPSPPHLILPFQSGSLSP